MRIALVVLGSLDCSGRAQHAAPVAQPIANVAPRAAPSLHPAPPTLATAGAKTCSLGDTVVLGPHGGSDPIVGFAAHAGLAAWISAPGVLSLQALTSAGAKLGAGVTAAIPAGIEPFAIEPRDGAFDVVLRHWDWHTRDQSWWRVVVEPSGQVRSPIAAAAEPAPVAASAADALEFTISNGAVPPPPGPGGRIIEAMGRPMLERQHAGQRVGDTTALEWHGDPIAHSMNVSTAIAWSGTHFIYPFWDADRGDTYIVALLPIDCRP